MKEYIEQVHTHVTLVPALAKRGMGWNGTHAIVLHTGSRVWILGSHVQDINDGVTEGIILVTDGIKPHDHDGDCLLSLPTFMVDHYLTPSEMMEIEESVT